MHDQQWPAGHTPKLPHHVDVLRVPGTPAAPVPRAASSPSPRIRRPAVASKTPSQRGC